MLTEYDMRFLVSKCTCVTKTPVTSHHDEFCEYRTTSEKVNKIHKLQSEHKELKEDFDTAYKELQGERKRADELQEQLDKKDEQIIKFVKAEARVQARLKGQRDRAERKVRRLEAKLKECVEVLENVESLMHMKAVQREILLLGICVTAGDLLNKLKRGD
jgi:predicted nuclease with TOPRIM domain